MYTIFLSSISLIKFFSFSLMFCLARFEHKSMTAAGNVQPALIKGFPSSQPVTCKQFRSPDIFHSTHQEVTGLFPHFFGGTEEQDPVGCGSLDIFSIEGSIFIHRNKSIDGGSFNISNVKSTFVLCIFSQTFATFCAARFVIKVMA